MQDCLVLDVSYKPVAFCNWESAIKLIYEEVATVIKEDESGAELHSPSITLKVPRVIRVKNFVAKKFLRSFSPNRKNIAVRDNNECQYCGEFVFESESTLDHVFPRSRGGKNSWTNLVLACKPCNRYKANRTPEEAGLILRSKPYEPKAFSPRMRTIRPEWEDWRGMGLF